MVCLTMEESQCHYLYGVSHYRGKSVSLFILCFSLWRKVSVIIYMACLTMEESQCHYSYGVSDYGGKSVSLFIWCVSLWRKVSVIIHMVCLTTEESQRHYSYGVSHHIGKSVLISCVTQLMLIIVKIVCLLMDESHCLHHESLYD